MRLVIKNLARSAALALVLAGLASGAFADDDTYALTNASLFDGVEDRIQRGVTVLVRDGKIEAITKNGVPAGDAYQVIDVDGYYLMPGLFDVHTHISALDQAQRALESGVTTVRSASVTAYEDVALRELVKAGRLAGPDVIAAGTYVTPDLGASLLADPRFSGIEQPVDTEAELRSLVRINASRGVDVIKTRGTERAGLAETDPRQQVYTRLQLATIVEEAARHGLDVMVHAHGDEGARAAVLAGARSIEHGTYLSSATLRLMKERGTWFVPTYVTMDEMNEEQYDHALRLRGRHMVPQLAQAIREAHALGVRIATGADNYYDDASINRISIEAEQLARLGLSNFEALQAATVSGAQLLRLEDQTGRIAAGYEADMILLPADPLRDITALQDVLLVMSNGRIALQRIPFGIDD